MFIKSLTISSGHQKIREIFFHLGLNLIVDETPLADEKQTGNNVGKTTVLMLIDFCLGANPKIIYTDPENKKSEYKTVKDFLINKQVIITLTLKEDLNTADSRELIIERNFLARKDIVRRINGNPSSTVSAGFSRFLTSPFIGPQGFQALKTPIFKKLL